ncbi:hypothetical protein WN51_05498 [Melipona quadrifasciata]|uniref:Uncharacterized protein n=1 Tax=Melipona quadrifasciata TaxID=166423 RepID=A0A0M9ACT1_9HYME|nr:hypothetical protein WN51_05498 [Melipona quadrifasciata]
MNKLLRYLIKDLTILRGQSCIYNESQLKPTVSQKADAFATAGIHLENKLLVDDIKKCSRGQGIKREIAGSSCSNYTHIPSHYVTYDTTLSHQIKSLRVLLISVNYNKISGTICAMKIPFLHFIYIAICILTFFTIVRISMPKTIRNCPLKSPLKSFCSYYEAVTTDVTRYIKQQNDVQKKKKATNYCIRFGHSLWSANQLPAQGLNYMILDNEYLERFENFEATCYIAVRYFDAASSVFRAIRNFNARESFGIAKGSVMSNERNERLTPAIRFMDVGEKFVFSANKVGRPILELTLQKKKEKEKIFEIYIKRVVIINHNKFGIAKIGKSRCLDVLDGFKCIVVYSNVELEDCARNCPSRIKEQLVISDIKYTINVKYHLCVKYSITSYIRSDKSEIYLNLLELKLMKFLKNNKTLCQEPNILDVKIGTEGQFSGIVATFFKRYSFEKSDATN